MKLKIRYAGVLALTLGVVIIISVLFEWCTVDLLLTERKVTGWELFSEYGDLLDHHYMPVAVVILGALSIVMGLIEFHDPENKVAEVMMIVIGILVIAFSYLVCFEFTDLPLNNAEMSFGVYLEFIAGSLLFAGGVLGVLEVFDKG